MTDGQPPFEDVDWRELTGYERHAACLVAARAGDTKALDALVTDLSPLVWYVARGQGLDRTEAEDVVQTVWLTLLRNLHSVAEPKALANWLIITTRREAIKIRSRRDRFGSQPEGELEQLPSDEGLPEEETLRSDRDRMLWRAFRHLSYECQELLRLTVLAGRAEYDYVAEKLGMPRGSIGPKRGRCIKRLRGYLDDEGGMS